MKKLLLLFMLGGLFTTASMAQDQKQTKHDPAEWDKKVKEELKLTPDQTVKYDALNKEYKDKFDVVMKDASLSPEAQKEKKMELKKEKQTKLFEILTPDQQAKYKELVEAKKQAKPSGY
jgi:Spy/CpxP family protein refolding chaperone